MSATLFLTLMVLPGADAAGPLHVEQPVIDAGEARAGVPLVRAFRVTNRSGGVLKVTDLRPVGCACLQARMGAQALLPGESAEVTVEVNTLAQPEGPNTWKSALRYCVDGKGPEREQVLHLKATVVREVSVEPAALVLIADGPVSHRITVSDRRAKPLSVRGVRVSSGHLKATHRGGQNGHEITLEVLETLPPGRHAAVLAVDTDDPDYRSLQVPVQVTRRDAAGVAALPDQVALRVAGKGAATALVRLRDARGRKVTVERIEVDNSVLQTKWAAGPGEMATVRVTLDAASGGKEGSAQLKVYLSEPPGEVVTVPVSWR